MFKQFLTTFFVLFVVVGCASNPEPSPTATVQQPLATEEILPPVPTEEKPATPEETTAPIVTEAATTEPVEPSPVPPSSALTLYEGISLEMPASLASITITPTLEAENLPSGEVPYWGVYPASYHIQFGSYLPTPTFHKPHIFIYPAPAFSELNPNAGDTLSQLGTLLANQPGLSTLTEIPAYPLFNAAQVFHAQASYLPFQNGNGIRFLALYAQSITPIHNGILFYGYVGLSSDGQQYVEAVFPIHAGILADVDPDTIDYNSLSENYANYLTETTATLNALSAADFTPTLTELDALIQSLTVSPPPAPAPTDESGQLLLEITSPINLATLTGGETTTITGQANPATTQAISLTLQAGLHRLAQAEAPVDNNGTWQTTLTLPLSVEGSAQLIALTESEVVSHTVTLARGNLPASTPIIDIYVPYPTDTAVAGAPLFLSGYVTNPINNSLTIGLLIKGCTEFAAQQSFTVGEQGGSWYGMVILPKGIAGTHCLTIYTGTYGTDNWREIQRSILVLDPTDPAARRILLGNPISQTFTAGQPATFYGTAVGIPTTQLLVTLSTFDNQTVLAQGTADINLQNYWELSLNLPAGNTGSLLLEVRAHLEPDTPYLQTLIFAK